MNDKQQRREAGWQKVVAMLGDERVTLSPHWSYNILNDPKRLAFVLSRYKFAARTATKNLNVLELGCGDGLGGLLLAEFAKHYTGVDSDHEAIEMARKNWTDSTFTFIEDDFMGKKYGDFDSVVSMDVIEHIKPECESEFLDTVDQNLKPDGICVIGTPNETAFAYSSLASKLGHVNVYSGERLKTVLQKRFRHVFLFGVNDEIVHTGFADMSHYLVALSCLKK